MDVVFGYCESWDTPLRTSKHHYAERLGRMGNRVLYVESPLTPVSILKRPSEFLARLRHVREGARPVLPNVWAVTGIYPLPYHRSAGLVFDRLALNTFNQRAMLPLLRRAMRQLGFRDPVLVSYYPMMLPILESIKPARVVLHMVDEWQGLSGIPRTMQSLTKGMLARADATIVSSRRLHDRYRDSARAIHLLRHGTDLGLFGPVRYGQVPPHERVAGLPGMKIGYYGALHKLDFSLVANVAARRPDWTFVFIGPLQGMQAVKRIGALPRNVMVWDAWKREDLPAFLAALNAFWMPFLRSELTHAMCPIKLFEALSAGVPVASSDLDETKEVGGNLVEYAVTSAEHVAALERALDRDAPADREARATSVRDHDWSVRIETFSKLLFGPAA